MPLSSIGSYAKANNLSINVYGVRNEEKLFYPLRVSQTIVSDRHVDLLLYKCNSIQHYTTIKSFSRLVSCQLSNLNAATYFCRRCLQMTPEFLEAHAVDCNPTQRTKFPMDSRCRFTNVQKQLTTPFVVYGDFKSKSILKPVNGDVDVTQGVDIGIESSSRVFQEHIPCSFAYKIVNNVDPDFSRSLVRYEGEDAADMFVCKLQQLFDEYIATPKQMLLTATESQSFSNATICHICTKPLGGDKVRDHCHITGNYRGEAHNVCNLLYRISKTYWKLPVVIHNLKGYDGHLNVKALKSEFRKVKVIPQNMEKYLSLTVGRLKFIDSVYSTRSRQTCKDSWR